MIDRLDPDIVKRIGCVVLVSQIFNSGHVHEARATLYFLSRKFAQHNHKCRQFLYVANCADIFRIPAEVRSDGSWSDYYQEAFEDYGHPMVTIDLLAYRSPAHEFQDYKFSPKPLREAHPVDFFMEHHLGTAKEILNKIFNRPN